MDSDYDLEKDVYGVARRDGSLLKLKATMAVEALMTPLLRHALSDACPPKEQLEISEHFKDLAGLNNKNQPVAQAAPFSIQINFPNGEQASLTHAPVAALDITPLRELNADLKGGLEDV